VRALAEQAGGTVFVADDPRLDAPLPQPRVDVLARLVRDEGFDGVLFAQSVLAADVAAGLAARLEAGLSWDLVDLAIRDGALVGTQPALGDSVYVEAGWTSPVALAILGGAPIFAAATRPRRSSRDSRVSLTSSRMRACRSWWTAAPWAACRSCSPTRARLTTTSACS